MNELTEENSSSDGISLKKKLSRSLFKSKMRAFFLVLPLLAFLSIFFVIPIINLLSQSFLDFRYATLMPSSTQALKDWNGKSFPTEEIAKAMVIDLILAKKNKTIGKVATRVNRELSGTRSLFTKTARAAKKMEAPYMEALIKKDKKWKNLKTWQAIKISSQAITPSYLLAAVDRKYTAEGKIIQQDENRRIHVTLFLRTIEISIIVTLATLLLGYPVAFLMASLPLRTSNLLLILVLLPFWTSLLVRTTAWIAMLQSSGVVNDLLVFFGVTADDARFSLIYNKTGTLIAMTHILLPFMILPIYSVMKTISPSFVMAAKSMGATNWTAFWRVYFPMTIPGVGAGAILVFILAIGYYITPALVGGQDGQMISNIIDFHMRKSLNWNLAAALGLVLLIFILFFFWLYDRFVGIDNMKLG